MLRKPFIINIVKLLSGSFLGSLLGLLLQIIIARNLSVENYGEFSAVVSFYAIIIPLISFGIGPFWLREFGKSGLNAIQLIKPALKLYILNVCVALVFVFVLIQTEFIKSSDYSYIYYYMFFYVIGQSSLDLTNAVNQVEGNYNLMNILHITPNFLRLIVVCCLLFFLNELDIDTVSLTFSAIGFLLLMFFIYFFINILINGIRLPQNFKMKQSRYLKKVKIPELICGSWPFALATVFHLIYFQSDIFLLNQIVGSDSAGRYSAMFIIITASLIIPNVIYQKYLLPKIHRWSNGNKGLLNEAINKGKYLMFFVGLLIMILIFLFSELLVKLLFNELYADSIQILRIMSINIPLLYLSSNFGITLVTGNYIKLKISIMGVVALLNISLNILFIPKFGINAALGSTILSNIFILISYYFYSKKYVLSSSN